MAKETTDTQAASAAVIPEQRQQAEAAMVQALSHHRQGELAAAEEHYRNVLELMPDHPDANHNLGVVVAQLHAPADGLPFLHKALTTNPANRQYWLTYAAGLIRAAHFKAARNIIDLGSKQGNLSAAQVDELLGKLRHTEKNLPRPTVNEEKTFKKLCRNPNLEPLEQFSRDLIERYPLHGLGYKGLGAVLKKQGDSEALAVMRKAAALLPDDAEVLAELGMLLHNRGQWKETEKCFTQALDINPELTAVLYHLGRLCHNQMRYDEAENYLRRALKLEPRASVYCALGNALRDAGKIGESEEMFRQALRLDAEYADAYYGLGGSLNHQGRMSEALDLLLRAVKLVPDNPGVLSMLLFTLNYHPDSSNDLLRKARHYGELVAAAATPFTTWQANPEPEKLRVGMISGDFISHPVGYFLENLLTHLDRDRIELIAYSANPIVDKVTARLKLLFDDWRPVYARGDEEVAKRIHADGLHLLIDLSGHTARNRLAMLAWKPAPVQATWLGYFATTGVDAIDYFIADRVGVPPERQQDFTENLWYLPETRLCFTPPAEDIAVAPLPALKNGHITFGCFQTITKIGDDVLSLWSRVLKQLPTARLRLQNKQFRDATVIAQFRRRLAEQGIDPQRATFFGSTGRAEYLAAHAEVDMILDCFPFPGGTTTCEALWTGVPTLTLAGASLIARQGASLLTAAGLPDWIAETSDDYVQKAVAFAGDIDALATLRAGLREQVLASPLIDGARFARHFEEALWGMWNSREQLSNKPKAPIEKLLTAEQNGTRTFLHVGCGPQRKTATTRGFNTDEWRELRLDIDEGVKPDIIGTMTDMSRVPDGAVDAIFSSHNIEHLYPHEVPLALGEFYRVLRAEGFAVITCPDLQSVCALVAEGKLTDTAYISPSGPIAPIDILYGHRTAMEKGNLYMAHRCGFTEKDLTAALCAAGFKSIATKARPANFDLWAIASKSNRSQEQMQGLVDLHFARSGR